MRVHKFDDNPQLGWFFLDYCSKSFGLLARGFEFTLANLSGSLKTFFEPPQDPISSETGMEETTSVSSHFS